MIDCKAYADEILDSVKGYGHLAVISVGNDPASQSYIKGKRRDCERVGFGFTHIQFPETVEWLELALTIGQLNLREDITGIIVQLPLPKHLDPEKVCNLVVPNKDVDGFREDSWFKPCTPEGIIHLLRKELGDLTGKHAVIIGRGKLVGNPLAKMLLDENMTVSVCHSKTPLETIYRLSLDANAIIVAAGVPKHFAFGGVWHNEKCVVVDCGVHRGEDGKLCGDVRYANTNKLTPVPGGVGLLTRAMLMKHVERKRTDD